MSLVLLKNLLRNVMTDATCLPGTKVGPPIPPSINRSSYSTFAREPVSMVPTTYLWIPLKKSHFGAFTLIFDLKTEDDSPV